MQIQYWQVSTRFISHPQEWGDLWIDMKLVGCLVIDLFQINYLSDVIFFAYYINIHYKVIY